MQSSVRNETTPAVDSVLMAVMAVGRLVRQRVEGDDLEPGTFWLLKTLASQPMRVTELAASTNLDTSTVSRHVAQLERSALVERTPDPDDGRAQRIALSDAGRARLENAFRSRRALLGRALQSWEPDDVAQLDRLLGRFVHDIDTFTSNLETA
jgi:DNA-binding MarR family transcriptional regulator